MTQGIIGQTQEAQDASLLGPMADAYGYPFLGLDQSTDAARRHEIGVVAPLRRIGRFLAPARFPIFRAAILNCAAESSHAYVHSDTSDSSPDR